MLIVKADQIKSDGILVMVSPKPVRDAMKIDKSSKIANYLASKKHILQPMFDLKGEVA